MTTTDPRTTRAQMAQDMVEAITGHLDRMAADRPRLTTHMLTSHRLGLTDDLGDAAHRAEHADQLAAQRLELTAAEAALGRL